METLVIVLASLLAAFVAFTFLLLYVVNKVLQFANEIDQHTKELDL